MDPFVTRGDTDYVTVAVNGNSIRTDCKTLVKTDPDRIEKPSRRRCCSAAAVTGLRPVADACDAINRFISRRQTRPLTEAGREPSSATTSQTARDSPLTRCVRASGLGSPRRDPREDDNDDNDAI